MHPNFITLISFINHNPDLKLLVSNIQQSDNQFWLVGGCLRNSLLNLPQVDIDIACSCDPTAMARSWGSEVAGHWFWLDSSRRQSRVLLQSGLTLDFSPLRSSTILNDLCLRDFTVNAMALPLATLSLNSVVLDPLEGMNHLHKKQLHCCSFQSFIDDPLRMLKGIRHAVTLDFKLSSETLRCIVSSKDLLSNTAGERIRDELSKIFNSDNAIKGLELLVDTGLLGVMFGVRGGGWNKDTTISEIGEFDRRIRELGLSEIGELSALYKEDSFSVCALFLLAKLIKSYVPDDLEDLLCSRLRLSRRQKDLIIELQAELNFEILSMLGSIEGRRRQALLVERLGPFFFEKILYWGVCGNHVTLDRTIELKNSFINEQNQGRIPALLSGKLISNLLGRDQVSQVGKWQQKLKLAEIKGEITKSSEAETWFKSNLSFDKKEA